MTIGEPCRSGTGISPVMVLPEVLTFGTFTQSPPLKYCISVGRFPELPVRQTLAEPSEIPSIFTSKYEGEFRSERFLHRVGNTLP